MSTCLLTNIKATRHDLGLTSALVDLRERESWFFSTLSSLSSLSSHFSGPYQKHTQKQEPKKTQKFIVPAMEGWPAGRQVDKQTFCDM